MKVLITGAFGNIGLSATQELLRRGHDVRCFDLKKKENLKVAKRIKAKAESVLGDLRNPEDVALVVKDRDVVVHLAFVIPRLSSTGVSSEEEPQWARSVDLMFKGMELSSGGQREHRYDKLVAQIKEKNMGPPLAGHAAADGLMRLLRSMQSE